MKKLQFSGTFKIEAVGSNTASFIAGEDDNLENVKSLTDLYEQLITKLLPPHTENKVTFIPTEVTLTDV